jgi:hypothetical protein
MPAGNSGTIRAGHMKFDVETEHELTYTLDVKYCLKVHNYKRDNGSNLFSIVRHIQRTQTLCVSNKFTAWLK